jgi:hypothetical protein
VAVRRTVGDGPSPQAEAGPSAERSGSLRPIHPPRTAAAAVALDVFERYPYGIVVVTRDGEVVAHNVAARRLMGDLASRLDEPGPGVLCEPLCCCKDEEGGHLEGVCLFERAADAHETLPEVRVDMAPVRRRSGSPPRRSAATGSA